MSPSVNKSSNRWPIAVICLSVLAACGGGGDLPEGSKVSVVGGIATVGPANGAAVTPPNGASSSTAGTASLPAGQTDANATSCFNPTLFRLGSTRIIEMKATYGTQGTAELQSSTTVGETTLYRNTNVGVVTETENSLPDKKFEASGAPTKITVTRRYVTTDQNTQSVLLYGSTANSTPLNNSSGATISDIAYNPNFQTRFSLKYGSSYTQAYDKSNRTTNSDGTSSESSTTNNLTTLFVGVESITVPGGTFKACRFEETGTSVLKLSGQAAKTNQSPQVTRWYGVKNGLLLKSVLVTSPLNAAENQVEEFVSGVINGVAVTP